MKPTLNTTLRVFIPFAFGYFLSYLFRVVNAVIAPDLVADLNIDPSELGLLSSTYFIAFASSQLPLGVVLDRFGPRKTESFLLLFAGLGALIFSRSDSLTGVVIGRAFIGFGVSACLMAAFKCYVLWFPSSLWTRINGCQMAAGGLGALVAATPVELALQVTNWRGLFLILAGITLAAAIIVFVVVPEKKSPTAETENFQSQIAGVKEVFTSMVFWRTAPLTTMSQAGFLSIQSLWSGPWLKDVAGFDRMDIAACLSTIALAMIAGFILLGFLAERLNRHGISVLTTSVTGMTVFMVVQIFIIFGVTSLAKPLWIMFGFFGTSGIIAYAALSQQFPSKLSGRVTTGINLLVFVFAFLCQWAIGGIIELWPVSSDGSYAPSGYQAGFSAVLCCQIISLIWFLSASRLKKLHLDPT